MTPPADDNDDRPDAPDGDARPRRVVWRPRGGPHTVSPVVWFFVGVGLLMVLAMLWLMPISRQVNALTWTGRMLGVASGAGQFSYGFQRSSVLFPAVLGLLVLSALSSTLAFYRRRTAAAVLGHLASAIGLRVPLPPYLRAAAQGERPTMKRRLLRLAHDLAAGQSIGAALTDSAGELPGLTIDRIAAAEKSFTLGDTLAEQLQRERLRLANTPSGGSLPYFVLLVLSVSAIVFLIMVFVMPKFAQIFADFKLQLPGVTRALIAVAGLLGGDAVLPLTLAVIVYPAAVLAACVLTASVARGLFTSRPLPLRGVLRPVIDRVQWHTPVFGRMVRDRHAAAACEVTAEALSAGRTLPEAIALANLPGLNAVLKKRLRRWRQLVEAGAAAGAAARAARLPRLWCDLMGGGASDPAAASDFAARAYAAAWGRRAAVVEAVLPVVMTMVMAAGVAFVAVALFTPMVSLIESLTVTRGRH